MKKSEELAEVASNLKGTLRHGDPLWYIAVMLAEIAHQLAIANEREV